MPDDRDDFRRKVESLFEAEIDPGLTMSDEPVSAEDLAGMDSVTLDAGGGGEVEFLRSTPARRHADDLLATLRSGVLVLDVGVMPAAEWMDAARALLAKVEGEATQR